MAQTTNPNDVARYSLRTADEVLELERLELRSLLPFWTIHEALAHAAATVPEKPAIIQVGNPGVPPRIINFVEYHTCVVRAANLFTAAAGRDLPVVAVIAPYVPEALVAMWGGATAGRYVPINPFLDVEHVAAIMRAAGANILVTATPALGRGVWDKLGALLAQTPEIAHVYVIGEDGEQDPRSFSDAVAAQPKALLFTPDTNPSRECAYLHTGGTTGNPKLVRHTQEGQLLQGWMCGMAMGSSADVVFGHAMPNFHLGGAIASGTRGIVYSQTIVTLTPDGFRNPTVLPRFWHIVREHGMTGIVTAPTTAAALLDAGGGPPSSDFRYTTGGGPLPTEVAKAFARRFGIQLKEVWGGTEFHGILSFHYDGDVPPRLGSCGRVVPFHRVISAVLDDNRFVREAGANERGVLIVAGPTTIPGYVDPTADAGLFVAGGPDGEKWATTGDIGVVDDDGFVWIQGREKDVIIRAGHNIDSALIDEVLAQHPAVLHAAAVGRPCPTKGELPIAYVELRPGALATAADLTEHARARIQERAAVPVEIIPIEAMPMTAVGKVSKPHLRIEALRALGESTCPERAVRVEEHGGKLILVINAISEDDRSRIADLFSPYTFTTRVDFAGAPG